jgi:hypothetical protein
MEGFTALTREQIEEALLTIVELSLGRSAGERRAIAEERLDALYEAAKRAARVRLRDDVHAVWREESRGRDIEHGGCEGEDGDG